MTRELTALVLTDDLAYAEILCGHLETMHEPKVRLTHCSSVDEAAVHLAAAPIDILFVDYELRAAKGDAFQRNMRPAGMLAPVIVVSNCVDPYLAFQLSKAGADALILKQDIGPESLRLCLNRAMAEAEDRNCQKPLVGHNKKVAQECLELNTDLANGSEEPVIEQANEAMYAAKELGRNRVCANGNSSAIPARHQTNTRRILAVDDDAGDVELLRRHLEGVPRLCFELVQGIDLDAARSEIALNTVDVVFLDYMLGAESGLEVLKGLRAAGFDRPIICLTGQGDEKIAAELIRHGADDYLVKADLEAEMLRRALDNASAEHRRREVEAENMRLLDELSNKNDELKTKNRRLAEMYNTAHEFVDNVSHEFRTPLTVIKEFTSIINDGLAGPTTDDQQEYLGTVLNRVDDLATMIDDMLDISKLEAGLLGVARRPATATEILDRVRTTLTRKAAANNVVLDIDGANELPELYCDPEKIGRVLINLSVNAIKFSPEDSRVALWSRFEVADAQVRFGISDSGSGIDAQNLAAIFDRFKQVEGNLRSSTKGFGLGLNIARELVHLNLGDIDVQSEIGQGSTFSFTVPTAEPSSLIRRYMRRVGTLRSGSSLVTLVVASIHAKVEPNIATDIGQFLQHQIRRSDLMFRTSVNTWLLVNASSQDETEALTRRIQEALYEANRNQPAGCLPDLNFHVIGTWNGCTDYAAFVSSFLKAMQQAEPAYA